MYVSVAAWLNSDGPEKQRRRGQILERVSKLFYSQSTGRVISGRFRERERERKRNRERDRERERQRETETERDREREAERQTHTHRSPPPPHTHTPRERRGGGGGGEGRETCRQAGRQTDRDSDREIQSGLKITPHRDRAAREYNFIKTGSQTAKEFLSLMVSVGR